MPLRRCFLLPLILCCALATQAANAYDVDAVSRATVQVLTSDARGSGTILVRGGEVLVLTNRHVVESHETVGISVLLDVTEPAEPLFTARLRGFSPEYDFAVLTITADADGNPVAADRLFSGDYGFVLPDLPVHDATNKENEVRRGDPVAVLGYPGIGDDDLVYTTGIISSVQYGEVNGQRLPMWYRTTAEMSPGNSGGTALDERGVYVGIPTSVRTEGRTGGRLGSLLAVPFALALLDDRDHLLADWQEYSGTRGSEQLDVTLPPEFASASLAGADVAAGHRVSMVSGGPVDVSYLGPECVGYAAVAPDHRFTLGESVDELYVLFSANEPADDTTIVVNLPDGSWLCNDDFGGGLDPGVQLPNAPAGQYDVWVGSYYQDDFVHGVLAVSRSPATGEVAAAAGLRLDIGGTPHFGRYSLRAGFVPDPYSVSVQAGGAVSVADQRIGRACAGYASMAPDLRLEWSAAAGPLAFYFVAATHGQDTTLVVNDPNNRWHCNDDAHSGTLNPMLRLATAPSGIYDVWVGTYGEGESISGTLNITELQPSVP
jgi:S1-C subfamily serine protease